MTTYLLAGGGTAGHVNPLLAVADRVRELEPDSLVLVLGTKEGLESRLVPERGYELVTIPRLPLPRRPSAAALKFPWRLGGTVRRVRRVIRDRGVDVVVGFGGYAAAPAYLAARSARVPIVVHEQNAKPGFANRLGSRLTRHVGVAFESTELPHAHHVGMPLRREIAQLDRPAARAEAAREFGLDPGRRTLLVTGGSSGAKQINQAIGTSIDRILATGWQVLHITGGLRDDFEAPQAGGYLPVRYCNRMELALAIADLALSRAGATTVSELNAVGVPAVYVPYAVGNGEQRLNASDSVRAGAALLVEDADFTPGWIESVLVPLLGDADRIERMAAAAAGMGGRDGADAMFELIQSALRMRR